MATQPGHTMIAAHDAASFGWRAYYPQDLEGSDNRQGSEEMPPRRFGVVRVVGTVLVICALLAYLVVPITTYTRTDVGGLGPNRIQPIPVAPMHKSRMLRT